MVKSDACRAGSVKLDKTIEKVVEELRFELVSIERAGGSRRSLVRVRIDRPDSMPGRSVVTVEDCASVSRAVHDRLEENGGIEEIILEVSSPGIERPIVRAADYERFAGQRIRLRGYGPLAGRGRTIEGQLIGLENDANVAVEIDGERLAVPLERIARARLIYDAKGGVEAS